MRTGHLHHVQGRWNEELLTHRLTRQGQEASDHSQEDEHLGSAEGKEGEDEADAQDDEAAEERGSGCPSPCCGRKETVINRQMCQIPQPLSKVWVAVFFLSTNYIWMEEQFFF